MAGTRAGMMLKPRSCQLRAGNAIRVCHIYTGEDKQTWLQRLKQGLVAAYRRVVGGEGKPEEPKEERKQLEAQRKPSVSKVDNATQTSDEGSYTPRRRSDSFAKPKKPIEVRKDQNKACWTPERPALPRAKVTCDMRLLEKYRAGNKQEERFARLLRVSGRKAAEVQTEEAASGLTVQASVAAVPSTPLPGGEVCSQSIEMDTDEVVECDSSYAYSATPCPATPYTTPHPTTPTPCPATPYTTPGPVTPCYTTPHPTTSCPATPISTLPLSASQPSVFGSATCPGSFHLGRLPSKARH